MIGKCLICNQKDANQTNSHLIPSFLVAMTTSYDGSYKRGKELMFTIGPYQRRVYTGALPDTKLGEIFDPISDDRIENELSKNTVALDYIFCSGCEQNLSKYLETPYSANLLRNQKVDNEIPLLFWISVVWRMSIGENNGFKLPVNIENTLHGYLKQYFAIKKGEYDISFTDFIKEVKFYYKILHCKDYSKDNAGMIYCQYDESNNILTMFLGDICICFMFDSDNLPENYKFYGLESYIRNAEINSGNDKEKRQDINIETYKKAIELFVKQSTRILVSGDLQIMDKLWIESGRLRYMPLRMKMTFLRLLHDDSIKLGEVNTPQRYVDIFNTLNDNILLWYLNCL